MSRRAAVLFVITAVCTSGLEGNPHAVQGQSLPMHRSVQMHRPMQAQECNRSGARVEAFARVGRM
jgi:hypothetical protein